MQNIDGIAKVDGKKKLAVENPGIDPGTSRMLSERSTITPLQEEERRLQVEYLAYQQQEVDKQLERERQIIAAKEAAKKELNKTVRRKKRAIKEKAAQVVQSSMIQRRELYSAFDTAQTQMIRALHARKAEVKVCILQWQHTL